MEEATLTVQSLVATQPLLVGLLTGVVVALLIAYFIIKRRKPKNEPEKPAKQEDMVSPPHYVILNETGNIVIASHRHPTEKLPEPVQRIFMEAITTLCMITKAIAATIDPETGRPCSIYNQFALERILANHPLFVHLGQESSHYKARRTKDFIEQTSNDMFGVNDNHDVNKKMAAIYNSMNVAAQTISQHGENPNARVGHLSLYCEDIMGIPVITAVLVHIGYEETVKLAEQAQKKVWDIRKDSIGIRKDSYLYNSPSMQEHFPAETLQMALKQAQSAVWVEKKKPEEDESEKPVEKPAPEG